MVLKGLETLDIRVRRQTETAAALADLIADHPKVVRTLYPGRADHPQHAVAVRFVRFSAGLEDVADLARDLLRALDAA